MAQTPRPTYSKTLNAHSCCIGSVKTWSWLHTAQTRNYVNRPTVYHWEGRVLRDFLATDTNVHIRWSPIWVQNHTIAHSVQSVVRTRRCELLTCVGTVGICEQLRVFWEVRYWRWYTIEGWATSTIWTGRVSKHNQQGYVSERKGVQAHRHIQLLDKILSSGSTAL